MRDENANGLEARVWVQTADGPVLIGERFRGQGGGLTMIWHIAPETILGVMWIEVIASEEGAVSAS